MKTLLKHTLSLIGQNASFKTRFTEKQKLARSATLLFGIVACGATVADDIEVFFTGSTVKPNILFVFDRSGSMEFDVLGNETSNYEERRGTILRNAFKQLLEQNKETINAGLGPFYRNEPSGVKWPIGDLTQNANEVDGSIPADGGLTSQNIIDKLFETSGDWGNTNIVDALYESALYFRGDEVRAAGGSWDGRFEPHQWNAAGGYFEGGEYRSPGPSTYTPMDAYVADAVALPVQTGSCKDYSIGGTVASGSNYCESDSSITRYDNCTYVAAQPGTGTKCIDSEYICHERNADGKCINEEYNCLATGPADDQAAYNNCTFYKENLTEGQWNGATYNSPIADSCQSNYIILLSDGEPTNVEATEEIKLLTNKTSCQDLSSTIFAGADPADANDGDCGIELAEFLANNEQRSDVQDSFVNTYTIGFGVDGPGKDYLTELALAGGGQFYPANDEDQLTQAFNDILLSISAQTEAFSAVSVDVDKASFSSDNRAFFSLFLPSASPSWQGNLKGYFIDSNGITDVNGNDAIVLTDDGATFSETSQSFWSATPDGMDVTIGGASAQIDPDNRNLYTYTGGAVPSNVSLVNDQHRLTSDNTNISSAMLGGHGPDVIDSLHKSPMADPLHSQPVTIKYQGRTVVYTMTNQGLLHAFDATTPLTTGDTSGGNELWAFMPQVLLKNLGDLKANSSTDEHIYGLDGGMTVWLDEQGISNGVIETGEKAMLYIGMRRGGTHYYALDVTNPEAPTLKWRLDAGSAKLKRLGQTWSRMALTNMKDNGTVKKVLIFGGGYDNRLDDSTEHMHQAADGSAILGNDVYVVDAINGGVIWSANNSNNDAEMRYSIPGDINIIDTDADGNADRFYFADLGGQVWRADFVNGDVQSSTTMSLETIAKLGTPGSFQPFFYSPSVALIRNRVDNYLAIAIGSGSRDNPINPTSDNAFYMIKDTNTDTGLPTDTSEWPYTLMDLYDATLDNLGSTEAAVVATAETELKQAAGWWIALDTGEKVLAKSTIFQSEVLFTTYTPVTDQVSDDPCAPAGSIGRFYRMKVQDARPVIHMSDPDANSSTPLVRDDRSSTIVRHGIPGPATIVFPKDSNSVDIYVGQKRVSEIGQNLNRMLWYAQ